MQGDSISSVLMDIIEEQLESAAIFLKHSQVQPKISSWEGIHLPYNLCYQRNHSPFEQSKIRV
jgi:hypothetical protein